MTTPKNSPASTPTNEELHRRRANAVPRGVSNLLAVYADHARNAEVWDVEGRRYIDFASGIAVLNTGHIHPKMQAAVAQQLSRLSHACFQVTPYESYIALAERLNAVAPGSTPKKTIFLSSGSFHGRTLMCIGLTGKVQPYKTGFGPMPPEIFHVPFPIAYHGITPEDSFRALDQLFKADVDPARVAAIIIEPVLGEGGFYIAPPAFLQKLRQLCDSHGILLIADEIQTGFGRTGRMFAIEHSGVEPDLMTIAKSLAGGVPLSAVVGKAPIMDAPPPGGLGGTFAGSPLGCAAGLAILDVIRQENLLERARQIGDRMVARLKALQLRLPCIGEVRGLGAMVSMELVRNREANAPDADLTKALTQAAGRKGLILLSCGVRSNVIRFLAPLTASEAIIDEGLEIVEGCLQELTESQRNTAAAATG
jgi:4-aminobutyrate aminotransferase / (S)-3-amino-2-methylpropionate transaminase / 5-aminovalerate transaminase